MNLFFCKSVRILFVVAAAVAFGGCERSAQKAVSVDDLPEGSPPFVFAFDEAMAEAGKLGKPVVAVFSASWCPPCQSNLKDVYPAQPVQALHDDFVWVYLDVDQPENKKVGQRFKVNGIPHIEVIHANGQGVGKRVGGLPPQAFVEFLTQAKSAAKALD